ncbi:hypothetical protein D3C72_2443550 [compost metagenome]
MFAQVLVLAAFLYISLISLISLGGYLLLLGFDAEHSQQQRMLALAGGGMIMLLSLWLLKVAMPRCISPTLAEPER